MSYKRTLVFLAIFVALAVFYYLYEIRGGAARRLVEDHEKLLFSFAAQEAVGLTLARGDETIVFEREGAGWKIVEPVVAPTEENAVEPMLEALARLKYERDIGPQASLDRFGLGEPELIVEVAGESGILGKISLGAETPGGSSLYVNLSDTGTVFITNKSIKGALDKSLFDLRGKKVVDFSLSDVAALAVAREGELLALETPDGTDWRMTFPEEHRADAGRIRRLLASIRSARVKRFTEEDAADLGKYGLEAPSARVELNLVDEIAVLYFGDKAGGEDSDNVFAMRDGDRGVFELSADMLDRLSTDVNDWRDMSLLDFRTEDIERMRITSRDWSIAVERSEDDRNEWRMIEPEPGGADSDEVEGALFYVYSTRVVRFLEADEAAGAARALENPVARLELWTATDDSPLTLLLAEKEEEFEAFAEAGPEGELSVVHSGIIDELVSDPERLKDRAVLKFETDELVKIEIVTGEESFSIERGELTWAPPEDLGIEAYEVDRFLWDLRRLDYAFAGPRDRDDAFYGFGSPTLTIRLWKAEADTALSLVVGKQTPDGGSRYVAGVDEGVVMEIKEGRLTEWFDKF